MTKYAYVNCLSEGLPVFGSSKELGIKPITLALNSGQKTRGAVRHYNLTFGPKKLAPTALQIHEGRGRKFVCLDSYGKSVK